MSFQVGIGSLGGTVFFQVGLCTPLQTMTKTIPVFLPVDGEASWSLLPSSVSLLSGGILQPEYTYFCILKVTGQV